MIPTTLLFIWLLYVIIGIFVSITFFIISDDQMTFIKFIRISLFWPPTLGYIIDDVWQDDD